MTKVLTIIGARPQFIKAAAVSHVFRDLPGINEVMVHTGQHYDSNMSDVFFSDLDIPEPAHNLGVGSDLHGAQTAKMLSALEELMLQENPDWVLVYGDTNSTLAGALAAAKLHIPIAHVEAGLRSFNRHMPEEVNRVLTDHAADALFAPTELAVKNLEREGLPAERVVLVGDVMYDAALLYAKKANSARTLESLGLTSPYILATVHRAENTDDAERLKTIFNALAVLAEDYRVVLPLHPRTKKALERENLLNLTSSIDLIKPVGYLEMIALERRAELILTDSGGVQKEAFFYQTPCVTLRDETEWQETLATGWNALAAPLTVETVIKHVEAGLAQKPKDTSYPYGNGDAAIKIAARLNQS